MSSAEAEFRGVAKGITEVLWLRKLLTELGFPPKRSCELYCDNQAAINISENPVQHDRPSNQASACEVQGSASRHSYEGSWNSVL